MQGGKRNEQQENLIRAAQVMFVTAEEDLVQAAQDVVLDKSDLNRIDGLSITNNFKWEKLLRRTTDKVWR